ncbi:hypothetical protein EOD40_14650 [Flavobacterium sufflavum]|uniref:Uncharacterized protein n=1 Tax=Flavobacterium sufflavum TaxID=1921138 RepID=A0A3S2V1P8_9FLAO|nr:DUF6526 family protein [Flavobacterium sufflavum]RVT73096.1 hypothetical protein EOD40_14650 [Flavobacterium sufflavum]
MSFLKYTPYLYLLFAVFFAYDAITKWNDVNATPVLSLLIAGLAVFMFFFRRRFAKKMQDRNRKS